MNIVSHDVDDLAAFSMGLSARLLNCLGQIDPNIFRLLTAAPDDVQSSQEDGRQKVVFFRTGTSRMFYDFLAIDSADLTLRIKALEVVVSHVETAVAKDQTALSSSVWINPESLIVHAQQLLDEMCALRSAPAFQIGDDEGSVQKMKNLIQPPISPIVAPGRSFRSFQR